MAAADHSSPLRRAIIKALKEDPAVSSTVGSSVYDEPPPEPVWPFIRYGRSTELPFEASCWAGQEADITLDAFAAGPGREPIDRLKRQIIRALDGARLTLRLSQEEADAGEPQPYTFSMDYVTSYVTNDTAQAGAYHAVIRFNAITAQTG